MKVIQRFITTMLSIAILLAIATPHFALAQYSPKSLNISGGLFLPSGLPVTSASVNFRLEIWDKNATCKLYEETHNAQNLSDTKGGFSLQLGEGSGGSNNVFGGAELTWQVFANPGAPATTVTGCPGGVVLNPGDDRLIRVYYDLGGGMTAMTPDVPIESSAYAMIADTIQGKSLNDLIVVRDDVGTDLTQSNVENVFSASNYAKLVQLLTNTLSASYSFNNQTITNVGAPSAGGDAVNKTYADSRVAGSAAYTSSVASGQTLIWNGSAWTVGVPTGTDNTKLPLAGGTMSGPITMGANDIYNTGHITVGNQRMITLGRYDNAQEGALSLAGADEGRMFYNTDTDQLRVWNGTAYIPFGSGTPTGVAGGDLTGTYPNPSINVGTVTTAKLATDAVTADKVDNAGAGINRIVMSDSVNPQLLRFKTCALNQILQWGGTGWACVDVGTALPATGIAAGMYGNSVTVPRIGLSASGVVTSATDVAINFPVVSVNGKTGVVVLNGADLGLGTASLEDVGNGANEIPMTDVGGKLNPSVIPTLSIGDISGAITQIVATAPITGGGTSGVVSIGLDTSNLDAARIRGNNVLAGLPADNQVLTWNNSASRWEARTPGAGADNLGTHIAAQNIQLNGFYLSGDGNNEGVFVAGAGNVGLGTNTPNANSILDINGLASMSAMIVPRDTQGNRPVGVNGMIRYNTNTAKMEVFENGIWSDVVQSPDGGILTLTGANGALVAGTATVKTVSIDTGVTTGQIVQVAASNRLPVIDGSNLTQISNLRNFNVATTTPTGSQVLQWNGSAWAPATLVDNAGVTFVGAGSGLLGGNITATGTISVDVGTGPNQIVQLDGTSRLPAVNGSQLTNVNAVQIQGNNVVAGVPADNQVLTWNNSAARWEARAPGAGADNLGTHIAAQNVQLNGFWLSGDGNNEGVFVAGAGNVGVGTNTPNVNSILDINGLASMSAMIVPRDTQANRPVGVNGMIRYNTNTAKMEIFENNGWVDVVQAADGGITALSGDVTASGSGSVAASIRNDRITTPMIKSSGGGVNRLLITDSSTGGTITFADSCAQDETLKWNTTLGWGCAPDIDTDSGLVAIAGTNGALVTGPALARTISIDTGVTTGQIVQVAAANRLPVIDGSNLTQISNLRNFNIATTTPTGSQVLQWNGSAWAPATLVDNAGVTFVGMGSGLVSGNITGAGTVTIDVGTGPNQIVQLDGTSRLPAVNGSQLTNVNAVQIQGNNVVAGVPADNQVLTWNNSAARWEARAPGAGADNLGSHIAAQNVQLNGFWLSGDGNNEGVFVAGAGNVGVGTNTPNVNSILDINGLASMSAMIVPRDTQANRPVGVNGMIRYNTNTAKMEVFENNGWVDVVQAGDGGITTLTGTNGALVTGTATVKTVAVDVGIGASQIPQLNAGGYLGIGTATVTTGAVADFYGATNLDSAVVLPRATSANRPTAGVNGMIRYNTSLAKFEVYENGNWSNVATGSTGDNLGNHIATTNVQLGNNWLGFDGTAGEGIRIDTNGRVGVGTATPSGIFSVAGANTDDAYFFNDNADVGDTTDGQSLFVTRRAAEGDASLEFKVDQYRQGNISSNYNLFVTTNEAFTGIYLQSPSVLIESQAVGIGTNAASAGAILDVRGTGSFSSMIIPRGSTAERAATGVNGMIRYNTNLSQFEVYQNNSWAQISTSASAGDNLGNHTATQALRLNGNWLSNDGGAEGIRIDNSGNVGVGTDTPGALFEVRKDQNSPAGALIKNMDTGAGGAAELAFQSSSGFAQIRKYSIAGGSSLQIQNQYGVALDSYGTGALGYILFATGGAEQARLDSVGNLGLGTATPGYKIDAYASGWVDTRVNNGLGELVTTVESTSSTASFDVATYPLLFKMGGNERMRIAQAGQVGIGTNSPNTNAVLDVFGTGNASAMLVPRATTAQRPVTAANGMIRYNTNISAFEVYQNNAWATLATGSGSVSALDDLSDAILAEPSGRTFVGPGVGAGYSGINNTGFGVLSMQAVTGGTFNTAFGTGTLRFNTGSGNAGFGEYALSTNVAGTNNTGLGVGSLSETNSGSNNTAVGYDSGGALGTTTALNRNVFLGTEAGSVADGADDNVMIGYQAGNTTTTGDRNILIGSGVMAPAAATSDWLNIGSLFVGNLSSKQVAIGNSTVTAGAALDIVGTGSNLSSMLVPRDTTANRPTAAANGMLRYNTNLSAFEVYQNSAWATLATGTGADNLGNHTATAAIRATNGTEALPSITFNSDLNTGMYRSGADEISFSVGAAQRLMIGEFASKFVTNDQSAVPLQLQNTSDNGGDSLAFLDYDGTARAGIGLIGNGQPAPYAGNLVLSTDWSADIMLAPNGWTSLYAEADSGLVSIGTSTVVNGALLNLRGTGVNYSSLLVPRDTTANRPNAAANGMLRYNTNLSAFEVYQNNNWATLSTSASGASQWTTVAGNEIHYSAANVGIGTNNPGAELHVFKTQTAPTQIEVENPSGGSNAWAEFLATSDIGWISVSAGGTNYGYNRISTSTHPLGFSTSGNYSMAIDSTGGVAIGTYALDVLTNIVNPPVDGLLVSGRVGLGTTSPNIGAIIDLNGTGNLSSMLVPRGTTAQRAVAGANGMIRYNTNLSAFEVYQNNAWAQLATGSSVGATNIDGLSDARYDSGDNDLFLGSGAGSAGGGGQSVGVGFNALNGQTSGVNNTAVGYQALMALSTTNGNTAMGYRAALSVNGGGNAAFGDDSLAGTGWENTALGSNSLFRNTNSSFNTGVGSQSLYENTSGASNTALGQSSLSGNNTGSFNTAIGREAGSGSVSAKNNNVFLGYRAGYGATTADNNILLGYQAGDNITSGDGNLIIGYNVDAPSATGLNQLSIGNLIFGTGVGTGTGTTISNGRIGIASNAPQAVLDVVGTGSASALIVPRDSIAARAGVGVNGMLRYNTNLSKFEVYENNNWYSVATGNSGASQWNNGASNSINYLAGGVGIGTNNPQGALHVLGEAGTAAQLTIDNPTGGVDEIATIAMAKNGVGIWGIDSRNNNEGLGDDFWISTFGPTPEFMIDVETGRVGISTTNPTAGTILDVNGTGVNFSSMLLPRGTTAERPTTGVNGMIRYNTNTASLEAYSGGGWADLSRGLIGKVTFANAGSCDWSSSATSFTAFSTNASCPNATVVGSNASSPGKYPAITISNLPPGDYEAMATGQIEASGSNGCAVRISDGTNSGGHSISWGSAVTPAAAFSYSTQQASVTFSIQVMKTGGAGAICWITNSNAYNNFEIWVKRL